jgi:hypothetical protein
MEKMKKVLVIVLIMLTMVAGCSASPANQTTNQPSNQLPTKPQDVAETFLQSLSSGDIDTCLGLLGDDVVFSQEPAGIKLQGKEQFKASLSSSLAWRQQYSLTSPLRANNDMVTFSATISRDDFRIMELELVAADFQLRIQQGKLTSWITNINSKDWDRLVELTAGGIGVRIEPVGQGIRIQELAQNSPARPAGINPGDIIIAINSIGCSQMRQGEAQIRIQGQVGSTVKLRVTHDGAPAPVDIEVIRVPLGQIRY